MRLWCRCLRAGSLSRFRAARTCVASEQNRSPCSAEDSTVETPREAGRTEPGLEARAGKGAPLGMGVEGWWCQQPHTHLAACSRGVDSASLGPRLGGTITG